MSFWQRWVRRPQGTWLRKALFQVHLWAGLTLGLYVVAICVSGSAIVFRNDVYDILQARLKVIPAGDVMSKDALEQALQSRNPGYRIQEIRKGRDQEEAAEVTLVRGSSERVRLVNPYTGEDRGGPVSGWFRLFRWLGELHGKLLWEEGGYVTNGIAGILVMGVALTGLIVWWPGITNWRRSLAMRRNVGWKRMTWDLHSAVGFWTFLLLFMWAFTGAYFVFPQPVRSVIEWFTPINPPRLPPPVVLNAAPGSGSTAALTPGANAAPRPRGPRRPRTRGQKILRSFSDAHYGTFGGWPVKTLWTLLGLAPVVLFGSALVMWWNRVLSPASRRIRRELMETVPPVNVSGD